MIDRKPLIDHRAIPTLVSGKSAFGRSPTGSGLSSGMQEVESGLAHVSRSNARFGRGRIGSGTAGERQAWSLRREFASPRFTTDWNELLRV
jgi:hypothetical protein